MKKRQFLAPVAVSVASLIGGAAVSAQASTVPGVTAPESAARTIPDQLVLKRSSQHELRLADHESHASHESHESHVSSS